MKKQNGITLVALVITIIVLLILAGVSISLALGQNGVLTRASGAVSANERAKVVEELGMAVNEAQTEYFTEMINKATLRKSEAYYLPTGASLSGTYTATTTFPQVFKNNCTGAASLLLDEVKTSDSDKSPTTGGIAKETGVDKDTASNTGHIVGIYEASGSGLYYAFKIDVDTGDLLVSKAGKETAAELLADDLVK